MSEMVTPTVEVRYSVLNLISRMSLFIGLALFFWFVASQMILQGWLTKTCYIFAVILGVMAFSHLYRLLTARGHVILSIGPTGFKDTRLTPTLIPWSAIQSVRPHYYRSRKPIGIMLTIDPAFKKSLSITLGARLSFLDNMSFGSVIDVGTRTLDIDADEISRVMASYIPQQV